jgi:haloalkane dehalogenase
MTEASLEQNMTAARHEHLIPGREIHMQDMRGYRFCEVGLITGTSQDNAIANIWNTTGACDPTPDQFDALDADTIARENGALRAWLNPVRRWMFDRLDVWEAGDDRTFGGITGTWMGVVGAATMMQATVQGSYYPGYIYRNNTFTFNRGSEVYLLDAPDGEVFVMRSFTRHWDPTLSEDNLAHLGSRLDLPDSWGFRAEILDQDLEVSSAKHDNLAHVLQDNLHNVYQGSDVGRAFSYLCREDAQW